MFKSIKRVTFYALCISLAIGGYFYTQSSHYAAFVASKMQEAQNSSEEKRNEISQPSDGEAVSSATDNGVPYQASTSSTPDYSITVQDGFAASAPTQSQTPALQDLSSTNGVNSMAGDIPSSNEGTTETSMPTTDFKHDVAFVNSELQIASTSLNNAADYTTATGSTTSSNASSASSQSRMASAENTASRVVGASNGGNTISFSPPPVIENPGGPNNGTDPYVPIDDYYGLFALLLCGGVIFWYRQKANKLVRVRG